MQAGRCIDCCIMCIFTFYGNLLPCDVCFEIICFFSRTIYTKLNSYGPEEIGSKYSLIKISVYCRGFIACNW